MSPSHLEPQVNTESRLRATVVVICLLAVLLGMGYLVPAPAAHATNPCEIIQYDPDPPIGPPDPMIAGTVYNYSTSAGIEGATMKLYRCQSGSAVYQATDTTDASGDYSFTNLADETWYYVEAVMTGPLSGKSPASGTSNPTAAIGIGDSVTDIDLAFQ